MGNIVAANYRNEVSHVTVFLWDKAAKQHLPLFVRIESLILAYERIIPLIPQRAGLNIVSEFSQMLSPIDRLLHRPATSLSHSNVDSESSSLQPRLQFFNIAGVFRENTS